MLPTVLLVELEDMIERTRIASLPNYYFFHMTNVSLGLFHLTLSNASETVKLIASRFLEFFDEEVKAHSCAVSSASVCLAVFRICGDD